MSDLCHVLEERIGELAGGADVDPTLERLRAHAEECPRCRSLLLQTERALEIYRRTRPAGPSGATLERLRHQARSVLLQERRAQTAWAWNRRLAVAVSFVIVAGLGFYLLRGQIERPADPPLIEHRNPIPEETREPAPSAPKLEQPPEVQAAEPRPDAGSVSPLAPEEAGEAKPPREGYAPAQPFPAVSPPAGEVRAPQRRDVVPQSSAPAKVEAPSAPAEFARARSSDLASRERPGEMSRESPADAYESSGRAALTARQPNPVVARCRELGSQARRNESDQVARGSALLAAADCLRAAEPEEAVDLYLEAASADPALRSSIEQRLLDLQESNVLPQAVRDRIAEWSRGGA